jgi:hypothetical protein
MSRVLRPIPIVQRDSRVYVSEHVLKSIHHLPMPREEGGAIVDVRRTMNLILLEPVADATRDLVFTASAIEAAIQCGDRVPQESPLARLHVRDVPPNSVS